MKTLSSNPFEKLYSPIPDRAAYLERIGFKGYPTPTLGHLCELMRCHLHSVPFENLDVFHGSLIPSLETEDLFKKIVTDKRGGYCFELNGLFLKLLLEIGYDAFASSARIILGCNHPTPPSHEILWVRIDGVLYFCDVGYGGPAPSGPLEFILDKTQTDCEGGKYRFTKRHLDIVLEVKLDGEFKPMMAVNQSPCEPVDFLPLNAYCATSSTAPFLSRQMVCIHTDSGKNTINNRILRIKENDVVTEEIIKCDDGLREALIRYFGIKYDKKLRETD